LGGPDEAGVQQVVERLERRRLLGDGRNQLGLKGLSGDRRGVQHDRRLGTQHRYLVPDRGRNRRWQARPVRPILVRSQDANVLMLEPPGRAARGRTGLNT
jgi:hypothetical protein